MHALLLAHKRKRISGISTLSFRRRSIKPTLFYLVFVTEARPRGLGYVIYNLLHTRNLNRQITELRLPKPSQPRAFQPL